MSTLESCPSNDFHYTAAVCPKPWKNGIESIYTYELSHSIPLTFPSKHSTFLHLNAAFWPRFVLHSSFLLISLIADFAMNFIVSINNEKESVDRGQKQQMQPHQQTSNGTKAKKPQEREKARALERIEYGMVCSHYFADIIYINIKRYTYNGSMCRPCNCLSWNWILVH